MSGLFPLPWKYDPEYGEVFDAENVSVCSAYDDEVNEFIVKACNSHHELAECLELAISLFGPVCNGGISGKWLKDAESIVNRLRSES